ncbi:hypothetical protein [Nocardia sp. NPDC058633]|uniref:hypothetical protein n=1 Tax=Nocardia sp. NPDC058633 TaxID=3346568 RepID=UPI003646D56E
MSDKRSRGRELVDSLTEPGDPLSLTVLVVEAGRIVDRLDTLDAVLSGDAETWLRLAEGREGAITVRVDSALTEARQQASVLRQLLVEIARRRKPDDDDEDDPLDDL